MPKLTTYLTVLAITAASVVSAQETAVEEPAQQTQDTVTAEGLSMGEEASSEPAPGDTYVNQEFGDWVLRCIVVPDQEDPCQMYQLLSDDEGSPIAEFTLFRLPEAGQAAAGATIIVPLETSLQEQLSIQVDDGSTKRYPFSFCNSLGCYARIGLTAEDVAAYKRGAGAVLSIVPVAAPDRRVNVNLSLNGFTAAYDEASVLDR